MNAPAASILVIDDEPDLRTLYELTLLREGYRVETASTVQEAREQLKSRLFDVVISDMRLPDGFGMEILQDLRDQQRRERCVVMTAYGSAENAVEALRAGAFDYLTKPVDLKQFRSVVASAVQGTGATPAPRAPRGGPAPRNQTADASTSAAPLIARPAGGGFGSHAQRQAAHRQGGPGHGAGAGAWRIRYRQGARRAGPACLQPARGRPVHCGELRRHPREPARSRILRCPQGLLHRSDTGPGWLLPGCARRHPFPG